MSLQTRIEKLEENCMGDAVSGARAYVRLAVELGCCTSENENALAEYCLRNGLTVAGVLAEVEGATRGLPRPVLETD